MRKLSIILCVIMMGFIFYMSSKTGFESNKKSFAVVNAVREEYKGTQNIENNVKSKSSLPVTKRQEKVNIYLRKNAHALEYLILAILISNAFFCNRYKGKGIIIYILFICLIFAVTDEYHQSFIVGRTANVRDVLIDFSGSLFGIAIYYFAYYFFYKKHNYKY